MMKISTTYFLYIYEGNVDGTEFICDETHKIAMSMLPNVQRPLHNNK